MIKKSILLVFLLLSVFIIVNQYPVKASTTITVPDDYSTIQMAINNANEGDTIFVKNGTYYESILVNKTITLTGENAKGTILDGNNSAHHAFTQVINIVSNGVQIEGFTIANSTNGIYTAANFTTIRYNRLQGNTNGIIIDDGQYNGGYYNIVKGNYVTDCIISPVEGYGIKVTGGSEDGSCFTLVEGNIVQNGYIGIVVSRGENNVIRENYVVNNSVGLAFGVYYSPQKGAKFYRNNVIDNLQQMFFFGWEDSTAILDNGYDGNYWSNYNDTDEDSDGIGDTPYIFNANNTDHYPLMNPYWIPSDINHDLIVDIYDVVLVSTAYNSEPGDSNWNPHADVITPFNYINIFDVVAVSNHYGEEYSPPY